MIKFLQLKILDAQYWLFRKALDREKTAEFLLKSQQEFLKEKLRNFPFWGKGHRALGLVSFYAEEIELAGASALACIALRDRNLIFDAHLLLGKCHLKKGETKEAQEIFLKLLSTFPPTAELREELAACYFSQGEYRQAEELLREIDPKLITQSAMAALEFCKLRTSQNPSPE